LVFDQTGSTNDVVAQLARSGAREGLVVFAESQTRGRGRHGRTWASPRGKGLWFSVLLRPRLQPPAAQKLTVAASVAVARAVRLAGSADARIKWPNDVAVGGRKVAGILTEARGGTAIMGIGVDVNCRRDDFPADVRPVATSLQIETGKPQDRAALAAALLDELDAVYRAALSDFGAVVDEWARLCATLGKHIVVGMGRRRIEGYAQALGGDGALLVRRDSGQIERILGGDLVKEQT
jgi:BirA family biotin operon repressor/biotin-[acetyl-CoA-carboxylase] ligase